MTDKPSPAAEAAAAGIASPFSGVPIEITVCVGRARPLIRARVPWVRGARAQ